MTLRSLDQVKNGETIEVSHLRLEQNPHLERLLSLGLAPGTTLKLIQRFPTYVVQANESQIAFDDIIAKSIFVSPS